VKRRLICAALAAGTSITGLRLARRYRRDIEAARARLAALERKTTPTRFGAVEHAERGSGEPLLAIHGIFGGCDAGLLPARDLAPDRRVIAPSRFGYLGSAMPPGATPADQADALALLLDGMAIERTDVVAVSAGATSALRLALRHPDRVERLAVLSGNLPGGPTATAPPRAARLLYTDLAMWLLRVLAWPTLIRLMGVPRGFRLSAEDARFLSELADSMFPVALRAEGATFDAFISNPDVTGYPLEAIEVPTLIAHAKDDPLASYEAAERAAARIAGARFVSIQSGGHLMLGQGEAIQTELGAFLAEWGGA
jgi:pimeloyl-ACP methyl ester carboxylesterase